MEQVIAIVAGAMLAASFYLLMRRSLLRFVIGLILLSNGVNLVIFTMGRLTRAQPPVIPKGAKVPPEPFANPLPQALILTAIVISFGLLAFTLVLVYRNFSVNKTVESDHVRTSEPTVEPEPAARVLAGLVILSLGLCDEALRRGENCHEQCECRQSSRGLHRLPSHLRFVG